MRIRVILAALGLMGLGTAGYAQDAEKGATVFKKCLACHTVEGTAKKLGPSLKGIVGRKAASVEGYKYSDAMLAKAAEGVIWDEATLAAYLPDPKGFVPGTKMSFPGLKNPEDVADLIAFLKTKAM
ncbi:MAG: c-type cytochrome [Hyphomicrobiales bacterium]